jgi:hypothetical protein
MEKGGCIMSKKISNQELCSALFTHGTVKEVATVLNVSERTIYNMMSDREFKQLYEYAQADILNKSVVECQKQIVEAVNCIADIMNDKKVNPQTRLQCANSIIKNTLSMYDVRNRMQKKAEDVTKSALDLAFEELL